MEEFIYYIGEEGSSEAIIVPKGFITDFASIPSLFWSIIGHPAGRYGKAAVIHDYIYHKHLYSRKKCDLIFYEAMQVLKVPFWKRWMMYHSVRIFGGIPWRRYKKNNLKNIS